MAFMRSISPSFRQKCRSKLFWMIGEHNFILKKLIVEYQDKKISNKVKSDLDTLKTEAIQRLVNKMEIKMTMPEDVIVK